VTPESLARSPTPAPAPAAGGAALRAWPLRLGLLATGRALRGLGAAHRWLQIRLALRERYRARPDDLFIVSYPRSGTTLMQMILYQLRTDGSMDLPHIGAVSPWFEVELVRGSPDLIEALPSPASSRATCDTGCCRGGRSSST
jgi:hypothetical protein